MATIETVRISKQGRDQLIKLKRVTGIENWNILCRWAFCVSLADPSPPANKHIPSDSSIEMTWRTFGGREEAVLDALLRYRCHTDGVELNDRDPAMQFRLHLHRGIGCLVAQLVQSDVAALIALAGKDVAISS